MLAALHGCVTLDAFALSTFWKHVCFFVNSDECMDRGQKNMVMWLATDDIKKLDWQLISHLVFRS
jgi:hypothetical protein